MKTMTCRALGSACHAAFHAATFAAIVQMSQAHGKAMFKQGDKPHLGAMSEVSTLMESAEGMAQWMLAKRQAFAAKGS